MNILDALELFQSRATKGIGLEGFIHFLDRIGNPQKRLRFIHITGTNGKGSTCAMIANVLMKAGYHVGLFTSPYIHRYQERIRINGKEISDEVLCRFADIVRCANEESMADGYESLNAFEYCTAIALLYYSSIPCDMVVWEVGIGGRLDTTNCITEKECLLSVITSVGLDHEQLLGNTITAIAKEKAGILKRERPVILGRLPIEAVQVVQETARQLHCPVEDSGQKQIRVLSSTLLGSAFDYEDLKGLQIGLVGDYQIANAAVALTAIECLASMDFSIPREAIYTGLRDTRWIGRMEILCRKPLVIVDGAHNIQGITAFFSTMERLLPGQPFRMILGVLGDKNIMEATPLLLKHVSAIYAVSPPSKRALPADELKKTLLRQGFQTVFTCETMTEALEKALDACSNEEAICIAGSLYQVAEARAYFGFRCFEDGIDFHP